MSASDRRDATSASDRRDATSASIVLIHGAWHRAACWHKVVAGLAERGITANALELPFEGFATDVAAARAAIVAAGDGAVVVGHSYGGAVLSAAASGLRNPKHLVYLCAFMLAENEDIGELTSRYPMPLFGLLQVVDGRTVVDQDGAVEMFYGDCSAYDVRVALEQLRPMPWSEPPAATRAAWRDLPSTYVLCTEDRTIVPELQRHMARHAAAVVEWPTSHSPFLSEPQRLVELLTRLAG